GDIDDIGTNTQYPDDTEAPTVPANVAAVALSHTEVQVTWDASTDNVGVTSYTVYRDTVVVGSVGGSTLSYNDGTASPDTTYDYTVEAFDAAVNGSGQSAPPANVTTPPTPSSFTVNPSADAYVNASNAARNYGSSSQLRADASPDVRSYVRFDVSGVTGSVTQATLRIYANSGSSVGVNISEVTDTSWNEGGINYANAPAVGSLLGSSTSFSGGTWVEVDLTAHVTGDGTYVVAVTTTSNTAISMASREATNTPELVIDTGP
ncbi:MAG: DNRLRE domain-containing protein, partial [Acidimicrobiia bacterium]|nr:DNRLRE domain-containing protein [Acidimicrobiia bacterium]